MKKSTRRLILIGFAGALLASAAALTLRGLKDSIVYFYGPAEIAQKAAPGQHVRLGGLVAKDSIKHPGGDELDFAVTDGAATVPVRFHGTQPDLFKEEKGVIAEGVWTAAGVFEAQSVLAKHDENYIPKEVAETLKKRGQWRGK
jgi:cytochrome c-type biogenesis protein CcmE